MKVLILGADGMLGHKIYEILSAYDQFDVYGTLRKKPARYLNFFEEKKIFFPMDVFELNKFEKIMEREDFDCVINTVGIVKSLINNKGPIDYISINSLFPHQLLKICNENKATVYHISTDCVFSGKTGMYKENDFVDSDDLYGRSKYLGELAYGNSLTLRTSIIGRELGNNRGLLEWFFNQEGKKIKGYTKAIFSGFTTIRFAKIIAWFLNNYSDLRGLYHISSKPISKFHLLSRIKNAFNLDIKIIPHDKPQIDRSLDCSKFKKMTGFIQPSWDEMIEEFIIDNKKYKKWSE